MKLIALTALLPIAFAQDGKPPRQDPPAPPMFDPGAGSDEAQPLLASDGEPVAPGRIPEGTDEIAVARWRAMIAATRGSVAEPITSFDVTFQAELRRPDGFNHVDAGFRYLDVRGGPYLRAHFSRDDRVTLRGPRGDYLIAGDNVEKMVGRHFAEDRRQLDQWVAIAGNFVSLTRPDAVRLVSLKSLETLPVEGDDPISAARVGFVGADPLDLPDPELAATGRTLAWIEVTSPDFGLYETHATGGSNAVFRARLGLDPATSEVRYAVLNEDSDGTVVIQTALFVRVQKYVDVKPGYRVPNGLEIRQVDLGRSPWTFEARNGITLWLKKGGRFNADLSARDFNE